MSEENKALIRKVYDAINSGDLAVMEASLPDSFVDHEELPGFPPTKEGLCNSLLDCGKPSLT